MFPAFHINIIRYIETDSDLVFDILYTVTYVDLDTVTSTWFFSSDIDFDYFMFVLILYFDNPLW